MSKPAKAREQAEPELLPWGVSLMSRTDRAALLEDTLDLWAHHSRRPPSVIGHTDSGRRGLTTPVADVPDRTARSRGADLLGLDHLATYGVPTDMTPKETTMSQNLEQHAESAARSLVDLVNALHRQGLQYPGEAYRIYSYLTRAAAEMRNALGLIGNAVQDLHSMGRLTSDLRGDSLEDVVRRFTENSHAAQDLAGGLADKTGTAYSAVGHLAYNEVPNRT
ncbi:hypothetical protein StrepF001_42650 [Streptomyces sp. F001]|uniref:hypothetical protein n=1 Tax=Streptomyces sp. F001 TaxID=1510026 RepID=UPI00101E6985|nr:hypothetical protein [Streptomyces sp. F001]RZB13709.1 hypothetical protein StrepF001_42650 [Streptomyces sp. F001]